MSQSAGDTLVRLVLCFIFPPLAVIDRGFGIMLLVFLLCFLGWFPGLIVALLLTLTRKRAGFTTNEPSPPEDASIRVAVPPPDGLPMRNRRNEPKSKE